MKRCPECRRDYFDDSLLYCLDDGAALLEGPSARETATAILHSTAAPSEAETRAQIHASDSRSQGTQDKAGDVAVKRSRVWMFAVAGLVVLVAGTFAVYRYLGHGGPKQIQSIAVLPFANESGNPDYEYLSDGLTEALINNLSRLPALSVKARSSVFSYKGKSATPRQVGSELSVQAVLNGRVMQRGDNLTLSVELVDASTGDQIWGEHYSRKMVDLTALESELARDVSENLEQKLTSAVEQQLVRTPTTDNVAYQLYLKGLFHWNKRTADDLRKAIEYFTQAKEKDPSFALAYVGLAITYSVLPSNSFVTKAEANDANMKAKAAASRALELDNSLAEAHAVLAMAKLNEWDFAGAENGLKRAIELNPNYATGYQWLSSVQTRVGRFEEAIAAIKRAYELDPFSVAVNMNLALVLHAAGRVEEAEAQYKKTIELAPDYPMAYGFLSDLYFDKRMYEEALAMTEKSSVLLKEATPEGAARKTVELRNALKTDGEKGYWRKMVAYSMEFYEQGKDAGFLVASAYAALGENDKAFEWLERLYAEHDPALADLKINSRLKSLRSDPRFQDLLKRVGLPLDEIR